MGTETDLQRFVVDKDVSHESKTVASPSTPLGSVCNLYQHTCPGKWCQPRWSRYNNHNDEQASVSESCRDFTIVHRQRFEDKKWTTESFTVQDATMRDHLRTALENYQDFDPDLENWTFKPPFIPLVHRWDRLAVLQDEFKCKDKSDPLFAIMEFMTPLLKPSVQALSDTKQTGKIEFLDLWHLFSPGSLAITTIYGVLSVCRVTKHELRGHTPEASHWNISLEYIDWNGEMCGYTTTTATVLHFEGFRHVNSLPVYPLQFNDQTTKLTTRLTERGRKFESLCGYHYQSCVGTKILLEPAKPEQRPASQLHYGLTHRANIYVRQVSGRVVVDAFAYFKSNKIVKPTLKPLNDATKRAKTLNGKQQDVGYTEYGDDSEYDSEYDVDDEMDMGFEGSWSDHPQRELEGPIMAASKRLGKDAARNESRVKLTREQCLLTTPWLRGLDMKTKQWAFFSVDDLSPVVWNDDAFDRLVLPGNEKQLSWQYVENKCIAENSFDDYIQDKGRGIIILMFGPPGVGKTYTAEAVAERARVPLYSVSAGSLGTDAHRVESRLEKALDLCELWKAMLLLDEADVFLTKRSNKDISRNQLVATFLTNLEYYPGVCFLTTNRVTTLDPALQSRVDLFLPYLDLTPAARRQVWQNFMDRSGREKFSLNDAEMDKLAELKLNGREIKNLIKSVHLLNLKDKATIGIDRVFSLAEARVRALANIAKE